MTARVPSRHAASRFMRRNVPFPLVLALRYLKSTRRDAFVSFLSAVAGGGLALGVAALILSLAALSGFQRVLLSQLLARSAQIDVELPPRTDAAAARTRALAVAGVEGAQILVRGQGWILGPGRRVQPVDLVGFEGQLPRSFAGSAGRPEGLYVGSDLASSWGLEAGDRLEVVSPRPTLTPFGPQPRLRTLPLAGTFESSRARDERERAALPLAVAESLLGGAALHLEIDAGGFGRTAPVARALREALPRGSRVRTWRDLNRPLVFVLHLEKGLMFVAVFLIVVVAALALVADLALIIADKQAEIGILGTMGATPDALARTFVLLGGGLGTAAVALGTIVGVGGARLLDHYRLLKVPSGVYFLDYVPFLVRPGDLVAVVGASLVLALASSWYAAKRAAALDPVEALRR